MKHLLILIISLLSCQRSPAAWSQPSPANGDLAIQNVAYFDSRHKTVIRDKTILIKGDIITQILDSDQAFQATKTIDGMGKMMVPGFVDTHLHLRQMLDLARSQAPTTIDDSYRKKLQEKVLNYGTTTVIDMGQPEEWMETSLSWQKNPSPSYPNNYLVGAALISNLKWNRNPAQHHTVVNDQEAAMQKITKYAKSGVQYLKLYWKLELDDMKAIITEANKYGMKLHAHVDQDIVSIPEAMDLGVKHFEHFFTVVPSILDYDPHWKAMEAKYNLPEMTGHIDDFSTRMLYFFKYISEDEALEQSLLQLFDRMAHENATISTAIHVLAAAAGETDFFSSFSHHPLRTAAALDKYSDLNKRDLKIALGKMMHYLKIAHDKGVKIRIGTDTREAGRALTSELGLLLKYDFPMEDVLQIATWNGAQATKLQDQYGTIAVGNKADLLLFDQDPFVDANNLMGTKTIIKGGKEFIPQPSQVDVMIQMLADDGLQATTTWIKQHSQNQLEAHELVEIAYHALNNTQIEASIELLALVEELYPDFELVYYEQVINWIGYQLVGEERLDEAIKLFELNVKAFPASWNVHDSLGEAYLTKGEKQLAKLSYQKSIDLNPKNEYGIKALKELEGN